jgi:hypothetical protein
MRCSSFIGKAERYLSLKAFVGRARGSDLDRLTAVRRDCRRRPALAVWRPGDTVHGAHCQQRFTRFKQSDTNRFPEKIFQVPFRVPGMTEIGRRALTVSVLPISAAKPESQGTTVPADNRPPLCSGLNCRAWVGAMHKAMPRNHLGVMNDPTWVSSGRRDAHGLK